MVDDAQQITGFSFRTELSIEGRDSKDSRRQRKDKRLQTETALHLQRAEFHQISKILHHLDLGN